VRKLEAEKISSRDRRKSDKNKKGISGEVPDTAEDDKPNTKEACGACSLF
jgi:hypothetical protein